MLRLKLLIVTAAVLLLAGSATSSSIDLKISGKGAVNDSTIIAGEPFSADLYFANDSVRLGFTVGFKISSDNIKDIVHVTDSGNGKNDRGDVKAYNGWEDNSIWDMQGLFVVESDWDGKLPELIGFGGVCIKKTYQPHERQKCLSIEMMVPTEGSFVIDSSFFPPSGKWLYASPNQAAHIPKWSGPYKFKVISAKAAKAIEGKAEKKSNN